MHCNYQGFSLVANETAWCTRKIASKELVLSSFTRIARLPGSVLVLVSAITSSGGIGHHHYIRMGRQQHVIQRRRGFGNRSSDWEDQSLVEHRRSCHISRGAVKESPQRRIDDSSRRRSTTMTSLGNAASFWLDDIEDRRRRHAPDRVAYTVHARTWTAWVDQDHIRIRR